MRRVAIDTGGTFTDCVLADEASGTAIFEPVGTNRDYAGHGFARAVLAEGLYRLRARGLHTAFVGTSAVNERALALYPTFGFREVDTLVHWERRAEARQRYRDSVQADPVPDSEPR